MSGYHAKLSPSGAHRWMPCPGSTILEAPFPNTSSTFADEGTAAHELASWCLIEKRDALDYLGTKIKVNNADYVVDADMARYVQNYVDLVRQEAEGGSLLTEQRVPIGQMTGEEGATGTADAVIIDGANRRIKVIDLKYGMGVKVDALDNPQLMMYALGAVDQYEMLADFAEITMIIHQPRLNHVSEFHVVRAQLEAFRTDVEVAAERVTEAGILATVGATDEEIRDGGFLQPGQKQCRFCKAKAVCPALRAEVADTVGRASAADFAEFMPVEVSPETETDYLSVAMGKVQLVEDWCRAIRAETERRLLAGQPVAGYKVVMGNRGKSQWVDEEAVAKLMKGFRLRNEEMFDQKLISPTKAKKLLEGNPRRIEKLEKLITRPAGKPSVALATDRRSEVTVSAVADDFRDLI